MLWIGRVQDPFVDNLIYDHKFDAPDYYTATIKFERYMWDNNPFLAAASPEIWVESSEYQPADLMTYAVFARDNASGAQQINYPDTWAEAVECANLMSECYDDVEICYGWPGRWEHVDTEDPEDPDIGRRLWYEYYMEAKINEDRASVQQ